MNSTRFLFRSLNYSSKAVFLRQQRQIIIGSRAFSILSNSSSTVRKAAIVKVLTTKN